MGRCHMAFLKEEVISIVDLGGCYSWRTYENKWYAVKKELNTYNSIAYEKYGYIDRTNLNILFTKMKNEYDYAKATFREKGW